MIHKLIFWYILNERKFILLYTVKCLQVFLSPVNISIYYKSFVCTQLNGFKLPYEQ